MSDSTFKTGMYPGYTTAQLKKLVAEGRDWKGGCNGKIAVELARREAVAAGDMTQATDGERLRAARYTASAETHAARPDPTPAPDSTTASDASTQDSAPAAVDALAPTAKPTKGALPAGRGHIRVEPFSIKVRGKRVDLGADVIIKTRQHFQTLAQQCIDEVESGTVRVNDRAKYVGTQRQAIEDSRAGKYDHTVTFRQMAVYFATGESVGLLG